MIALNKRLFADKNLHRCKCKYSDVLSCQVCWEPLQRVTLNNLQILTSEDLRWCYLFYFFLCFWSLTTPGQHWLDCNDQNSVNMLICDELLTLRALSPGSRSMEEWCLEDGLEWLRPYCPSLSWRWPSPTSGRTGLPESVPTSPSTSTSEIISRTNGRVNSSFSGHLKTTLANS